MEWGGRAWGGQRSICAGSQVWRQSRLREREDPITPVHFFSAGEDKEEAACTHWSAQRQRTESEEGDGGRRIRRRSFIKDRNIYRNLHSRLLSTAWGAWAQDSCHHCHCGTRLDETPHRGNKKMKENKVTSSKWQQGGWPLQNCAEQNDLKDVMQDNTASFPQLNKVFR